MIPRPPTPSNRGAALIVVMGLVAFLLMVVGSILFYSSSVHRRGVRAARVLTEQECTESGLQIARNYFTSKYKESNGWNNYLSHPETYNPIGVAGVHSFPKAILPADALPASTLRTQHPELFADLDGDGRPDVYIYVRDDDDGDGDPTKDSNRIVYFGGVCISDTLVPRREDGTVSSNMPLLEGLGEAPARDEYVEKHGGPTGTGNLNDGAHGGQ